MRLLSLLILALGFPFLLFSKEYTIETVPNPKDYGNFYVSNPDNIFSPAEKDTLDALCSIIEDSTTCQVAVVAVKSIGDENPKDFASRLFNHWGIGDKEKNNGVLVFLVLDQKRIEIETGYGVEEYIPDVICARILREDVVPYFKEGRYGKGVILGMIQLYYRLDSKYVPETTDTDSYSYQYTDADYMAMMVEVNRADHELFVTWTPIVLGGFYLILLFDFIRRIRFGGFKGFKNKSGANKYEMPISLIGWIFMYMLLPAVVVSYPFFSEPDTFDLENNQLIMGLLIYGYFGVTLLDKRRRINNHVIKDARTPYEKYTRLTLSNHKWIWVTLFFPMHLIPYWFLYSFRKKRLRNTPLECKKCHKQMRKLDETEDDQKLVQAQILEEQLKSIDYDVWHCADCSGFEVLKYVNHWSRYDDCPKCRTKAYYLDSDKTIKEATYTSTGTGLKTYLCKHCQYKQEKIYTIPKRERSDSSGSSYSSSSGSSWSSGGGGSSGGSWGGGRSGGGGAGSSW